MKKYRISLLLLSLLLIILFINCNTKEKTPHNKWVSLFNGKNLDGWTMKIRRHPLGENYNNTFIVEDGVIKVNYDEYDGKFNATYGHLFYKKSFSNYKFRMEYRFTGKQVADGPGWAKRNNGIMIHCEAPEHMGINQDFPVSIEVQLLGGLGDGERPTGNLCTPGTNVIMNNELFTPHCINSSSDTFDGDQWVKVEVEVWNDSIIKHFINGEKVMTYYKPQIGGKVDANQEYWKSMEGTPLKKGYISLQSESHPCEFRNIEILEL